MAPKAKHIGGAISAPVLIHSAEPAFSAEARAAKKGGQVLVNLLVDEHGMPLQVRVLRGVGLGLDEAAVAAVKQYRFKPALENGRPVLVELNVEVNFQIFDKKPTTSAAPWPQQSGGADPADTFPETKYPADPKFGAAWKEATQFAGVRNYGASISSYRKANKIAAGKCAECLRQAFALSIKIGDYKGAANAAADLVLAVDTPAERSKAESMQGQAVVFMGGDKPKPANLKIADDVLKAAIADDPKNMTAHFIEGKVLAQMGDIDGARTQFEACVREVSQNDPTYARAQHFAENPLLSIQRRAPAFTVTALDGSKFTLDEMGGRVVLVDFWATWCGPCNEELPQMRRIAKDFAGQPLVILSISWDDDAARWKDFIAKNGMTWMQYRDADHSLTKRFGIEAIPHYFTIDSDGVLQSEILGSGTDVEGKLRKLVARAKAAPANVAAAGPAALQGPLP